jgi:hypothetical protein
MAEFAPIRRTNSRQGGWDVSILSRLRSLYFHHISTPAPDRPVCQAIQVSKARKIVELGVGDGQRALRMIEAARLASPNQEICYIGMDLFEGRSESDGPGLTLKEAHRLLRGDRLRVQLVPGCPADSLMRTANSLGKVDLLILPSEMESSAQTRAWYFIPRMLHEGSVVFVEPDASVDSQKASWIPKTRDEIDSLAAAGAKRRAA